MSGIQIQSPIYVTVSPTSGLNAATKAYVASKLEHIQASEFASGIIDHFRLPGFSGAFTVPAGGSEATLSPSGVTTGTYTYVNVNSGGYVVGARNLTTSDIISFPWNKVTTGKPSTAIGYGLSGVIGRQGGVVTGNLSSGTAPVQPEHLVNKSYVDTLVSSYPIVTLPIGSVVRYVGESKPDTNYLRCNGSPVLKAMYPDLYSKCGDLASTKYTNNGKPWRQQYSFNKEQMSGISNWVIGNPLPGPIGRSQVIVTKNRIYLLGGRSSNSSAAAVATVYTCGINEDGSLSAWSSSGSLPGPVWGSHAITVNNHVYLIGGNNGAGYQAFVYRASINSDGTLSAWTTLSPLPMPVSQGQAIVIKDKIYLLGGTNNASVTSTIYTATVDSVGNLSSWTTAGTIPTTLLGACTVVTDKFVYLVGGHNGAVYTANSYMCPIGADGTLGIWVTSTSLPVAISWGEIITTKYKAYLISSHATPSTGRSVYTAPINADGTLGTWVVDLPFPQDVITASIAVVRNRIYVIGGQDLSTGTVSSIYSATFDGGLNDYSDYYKVVDLVPAITSSSGKPWNQQYGINNSQSSQLSGWNTTTPLPEPVVNAQAIVTVNRVYLIGGQNGSGDSSTILTTTINTDGTLNAWSATTPLPMAFTLSQSVVTAGRLHLIGGYNDTQGLLSTVHTCVINSDGTLGAWSTGTSLPSAFSNSLAFSTKNTVYTLGGQGPSGPISTIHSAPINSDGTLGTWSVSGNLPWPVYDSQIAVTKSKVYVLGGFLTSGNTNGTFSATINEDGTLGAWASSGTLPIVTSLHQVFVTTNAIYLIPSIYTDMYMAPIDVDGNIGTWVLGTNLPAPLDNTQVVATKNHLYVLGGSDGDYVRQPTVYMATITGGLNDYSSYYGSVVPPTETLSFNVPDFTTMEMRNKGVEYYIKAL